MGVSKLSEIVALGFEELITEGDTREIGKFLAFPTERIIAPQWLRDECGIETVKSPDDEEGQQEKYDRLSLSSRRLRIQVKHRGGNSLHMEQTRRTTGKNAEAGAKNGQVRYSIDSFDVVLFIIPNGYDDISSWEYLAIPSYELEDKNMPGYCVGSVPAKIRRKYTGRAKEVLIELNNAKRIH
jgi:hypothetical protein